MPWVQTAEPAVLAVNFSELKAHLRLDTTDEDALLEMYAKAAIDLVETETRRRLISRTFRLELPDFPLSEIEIPLAPLASVSSVQYYLSSVLTTFSSAKYIVDATSLLGRVVLVSGETFPQADTRVDAVRVNFTAGYGASYTAVPAGLRMAVQFLAAHFFVNRVPVGNVGEQIPMTLRYAIDAYKIWAA